MIAFIQITGGPEITWENIVQVAPVVLFSFFIAAGMAGIVMLLVMFFTEWKK